MDPTHWDNIWTTRSPEDVTWYQQVPAVSLRLIDSVADSNARIVDVGGGASRLVDHLIDRGYTDLAVNDLSSTALEASKRRLGQAATSVEWLVGDVTTTTFDRPIDVWHDRAVFHFLTGEADRSRYREVFATSLSSTGHAVIATFAADGPERCSGLPTCRYDAHQLADAMGDFLVPIHEEIDVHVSPSGVEQRFQYVVFRRASQTGPGHGPD